MKGACTKLEKEAHITLSFYSMGKDTHDVQGICMDEFEFQWKIFLGIHLVGNMVVEILFHVFQLIPYRFLVFLFTVGIQITQLGHVCFDAYLSKGGNYHVFHVIFSMIIYMFFFNLRASLIV
ncbi:hypothetical protein ACJX0J_040473 [Zea mays]